MRCIQPAEYLSARGARTGVGCIYRSLCKARSVIVFHRAISDLYTRQYLSYARYKGLVTIYDIDDLLFDETAITHLDLLTSDDEVHNGESVAISYREVIKQCNIVLVSTNYLKRKIELFHDDVRLVRNGLSHDFIRHANDFYNPISSDARNFVTISYMSGSQHHDQDFEIVEKDLISILENHSRVRLILIGKLRYSDSFKKFGQRFQYKTFIKYSEYPKSFDDVDINIVPLRVDDPFSQARSELKYVEAGMFGIPTIASCTDTYREAISHGINGLLVGERDWYGALEFLITNSQKRGELGEAARRDVMKNYSPGEKEEEWESLISDIMEQYSPASTYNGLMSSVYYLRMVVFLAVRRLYILKKYIRNSFYK